MEISTRNNDKYPRFFILCFQLFKILFYERRLPDRFIVFKENLLHKRSTDKIIRKILDTPKIKLELPSTTEIHMLINKAHVSMALLALKSFLRYYNNVKIVIHGDGTLSYVEENILKSHIDGLEVITLKSANRLLKNDKDVYWARDYCQNNFHFSRKFAFIKLLDMYFLSEQKKLILLDSDIIFLKRPNEIIEWIAENKDFNIHAVPYGNNLTMETSILKENFQNIQIFEKFNSGILCIDKKLIRRNTIISTIKKIKNDTRLKMLGDESVWRIIFGQSVSKQLQFENYPLFSKKIFFKKFLNKKHDMIYLHFLLKHHGGFYRKFASKVISEINFSLK